MLRVSSWLSRDGLFRAESIICSQTLHFMKQISIRKHFFFVLRLQKIHTNQIYCKGSLLVSELAYIPFPCSSIQQSHTYSKFVIRIFLSFADGSGVLKLNDLIDGVKAVRESTGAVRESLISAVWQHDTGSARRWMWYDGVAVYMLS